MVAIISRPSDLVPVEFKDSGVTLYFSPVRQKDKIKLSSKFQSLKQDDLEAVLNASKDLLKCCLKDCEGIEFSDGEPFKFDKDKQGMVTDDSLDTLLELDFVDKIYLVAGLFLRSVPKQGKLTNPETGEEIPNVVVKKKIVGKK